MAILSTNEIFYQSFEPKQPFRFIMYCEGIPSFMIKKVSGIKANQNPVTINHINVQRYVKGKTKWDPITLTLFDPISPSGSQAVMNWVRLHHESVTGRNGYSDFYKKDLAFHALGPVGDIVSEIIIKGALIQDFDLGEYDWDSDGQAQEITMTIQPDFCIVNY